MKHVVYVGPHDEVEIVHQGETVAVARRGEEVEVDSDLGDSLLAQTDNWKSPARAAKKLDKESDQ